MGRPGQLEGSTHAKIPMLSERLQRLASTAGTGIWGQCQGAVALGALQLVGVQQASASIGSRKYGKGSHVEPPKFGKYVCSTLVFYCSNFGKFNTKNMLFFTVQIFFPGKHKSVFPVQVVKWQKIEKFVRKTAQD